ncbi:hypothetical protein P1X14_11895 [Sphingomonas sp. AOB5]|uniref:hypothetical protein n=1 Tax=Sphingomonas sp. AOB5 TaxID=3034017 RepID=UPI0023F6FC59|nr:hypothetical protein [Sphingomonas sp. AOB5]MDF7775950.1 hypothetical protein [Sphingomonas sp. AOB5]
MIRRCKTLVPALFGVVYFLLCGSSALAQQASSPELLIGKVSEGSLDMAAVGNGWRPRQFNLTLAPNASVRIDLESEDFDPIVRVYEIRDGRRFNIAENDDFGDTFNARVRFTTATGGTFVVEADTVVGFGEPERGHSHFRLTASEEAPRTRPEPVKLGFDAPIESKFSSADEVEDGQGLVQRYAFHATRGQRIVLNMAALPVGSDSEDSPNLSSMELYRASDPGLRLDMPNKRRSLTTTRAMALIPEDGDYILIVRHSDTRASAPYRLDAKLFTAVVPVARAIRSGETKRGEFTFADPQTSGSLGEDPGRLYQEWLLPVRRGQSLRVELCGTDSLDALIQVIGATVIGDRLLASADDLAPGETASCGPARRNAGLDLTASENGTLRLLVSPLRDTGSYTLVVSERAARPANAATGQ